MLYLDAIKWIGGRCVIFAFISVLAIAMSLAYRYVPPVVDQVKTLDRLNSQKEQKENDLESVKSRRRANEQEIRKLEAKHNFLKRWVARLFYSSLIDGLDDLVQERSAIEHQAKSLEQSLKSINDEIITNKTGVGKFVAAVSSAWFRVRGGIIWIAFLVVFGPFMSRVIKLALAILGLPRLKKIQLLDAAGCTVVRSGPSDRKVTVPLRPGERIIVRSDWIEERDESIRERGRWLWRLRSPAISYAAGLISCSVIESADSDGETAALRLSAPSADDYLTVIDLQPEQSLCLRPRAIVGLSESVTVKTHWRIANLHAWLFGQLRYLVFEGPGIIVVVGNGGLETSTVQSQRKRVAIDRVVGFEPQLCLATVASGNYRSYLFGKTPLAEVVLTGHGNVLRRLALPLRSDNLLTRTLGGFFSAIGKVLGF